MRANHDEPVPGLVFSADRERHDGGQPSGVKILPHWFESRPVEPVFFRDFSKAIREQPLRRRDHRVVRRPTVVEKRDHLFRSEVDPESDFWDVIVVYLVVVVLVVVVRVVCCWCVCFSRRRYREERGSKVVDGRNEENDDGAGVVGFFYMFFWTQKKSLLFFLSLSLSLSLCG